MRKLPSHIAHYDSRFNTASVASCMELARLHSTRIRQQDETRGKVMDVKLMHCN